MKKRLLSLFLALIMVLTVLPAGVFAEELPEEAPPVEDPIPEEIPDEIPEEEIENPLEPEEGEEEAAPAWIETVYAGGELLAGEELLFTMVLHAADYAGKAGQIVFAFKNGEDAVDFTGVQEAAFRIQGADWTPFHDETTIVLAALEDMEIEFRIVFAAGGDYTFGYTIGTDEEGVLGGGADFLTVHEDNGEGFCKVCGSCLHELDENWWCTVEDCDHPDDCFCRESMTEDPEVPEQPEEPEEPEEPDEPEQPEKEIFVIYAEDIGRGDISPEGRVEVEEGDDLTFHFYPDKGYRVAAVYVDGVEVSEYGFWYDHYWNCSGCKDCWWIDWSEWLDCDHDWCCDKDHYHFPVCEWEEYGDGITFYDVSDDHWLYVEFEPVAKECPTEEYWDLSSGAWYHGATDFVLKEGLMEGVGGGYFDPYGNTTRAQLVTMLYRMEGEPRVKGGSEFYDVAADSWYADAVTWAAKKGIVEGYGNGFFGVDDAVTREQTVAILYRYAEYRGCRITDLANLSYFLDAELVSDYAVKPFRWAVGEDIVEGEPSAYGLKLDPKGVTARVEMAAMIARYAEFVD